MHKKARPVSSLTCRLVTGRARLRGDVAKQGHCWATLLLGQHCDKLCYVLDAAAGVEGNLLPLSLIHI